jgi:hypothetical protein
MKTIAKRSLVLAAAVCISSGVMAQLNMRVTQQAEATLRLQQQQRLSERSTELLRKQAASTRETTQKVKSELQSRAQRTGDKVKATTNAGVEKSADVVQAGKERSKKEMRRMKKELRKQRKLEARGSANAETQVSRKPGKLNASGNSQVSGSVEY